MMRFGMILDRTDQTLGVYFPEQTGALEILGRPSSLLAL